MARFTTTKEIKGFTGVCIPINESYISFQEPFPYIDYDNDSIYIKSSCKPSLYLYGPAIDKLNEYENIRDNPQEIREELHRGQVAWNDNFNLRAEISDLKEKMGKAEHDLSYISSARDYFRREYGNYSERNKKLESKVHSLEEENEQLKRENEHLKTATLAHDIVSLLDERDALKREGNNLIKTIECRDNRISELIDEIDKLKDELASYVHFSTLKNKQLGKLHDKVESLKKSNAEKDKEIERLQKRIDNLKDALLAD